MAQTIHLEPSQVPAQLKGAYLGAKFKAVVCERVRVPMWLYDVCDIKPAQPRGRRG